LRQSTSRPFSALGIGLLLVSFCSAEAKADIVSFVDYPPYRSISVSSTDQSHGSAYVVADASDLDKTVLSETTDRYAVGYDKSNISTDSLSFNIGATTAVTSTAIVYNGSSYTTYEADAYSNIVLYFFVNEPCFYSVVANESLSGPGAGQNTGYYGVYAYLEVYDSPSPLYYYGLDAPISEGSTTGYLIPGTEYKFYTEILLHSYFPGDQATSNITGSLTFTALPEPNTLAFLVVVATVGICRRRARPRDSSVGRIICQERIRVA
jgi:hypothetical protein